MQDAELCLRSVLVGQSLSGAERRGVTRYICLTSTQCQGAFIIFVTETIETGSTLAQTP